MRGFKMKTIVLLLIALVSLTGTARAQSILGGSSSDVWAVDGGSVDTLANGEQWLILHNQGGLGIQLQPGMPAAATFETNIVINAGDDGGSAQILIAGDCWEKTYSIMGAQHYQHTYRIGLPIGTPVAGDGVIRQVKPGQDVEMVSVFAAVCASGTPGAALNAGGPKLSPFIP
jgi:hypothetical protein